MVPRLPNPRAPQPPPSQICGLFGLSYLCSMLFNINNKRALMLVPLPWTFAALNLSIGSVIALLSWSIKVAPWPRITRQDLAVLVPMGFLHAVSHLTVVLGLGAGAVSFLQTVKAAEACFTALLSYLFLGQTMPLPVYLTLLPVVAGVALTCCGQGLRFSWVGLLSALVSHLPNAMGNVLIVKNIGPAAAAAGRRRSSLKTEASPPRSSSASFLRPTAANTAADPSFLSNPVARSASALANTRAGGEATTRRRRESGLASLARGDTYRLLTVVGAALIIPAAAYMERDSWPRLWRAAMDATAALVGRTTSADGSPPLLGEALLSAAGSGGDSAAAAGGRVSAVAEAAVEAAARGQWAEAFRRAVLAGVSFNLFYDLTFRLLGQLHPVTHAVGNTIKRIVVIAAGAFAFGGDLGGARGVLGSALAVIGVLGYSLSKARCKTTTGSGCTG
ncbi:Triose phosphate/phosphate translocator, non-green plastid, chloroplast precursor, putative [Ectocarpus siliculosus]|uniref:Triose phosphate/phosphate translocator, non-green plastid, chloroplast, putative n=1 Tax=Ectocarpus siliculosus TaxID=2880 RepID=D7FS04_ECTSI|nr:Triose phosphate/phosphate translocator, non-green plastid, chloroplast precursor, putative [Ectocarpus siliculosus]|eukprot:CBJ30945.1 Triose phosphate/phosphate translocator, non-green plastid, chloroplast precursor, putative [Ectocarpus siliculosus]